jgi:hypothetical protein
MGEQRFYFLAEFQISAARTLEKCGALSLGMIQCGVVQLLQPPGSLSIHLPFPRSSLR